MKISTAEVREGNCDGEIVWICHYHRPDMYKKALRNVPPTRVIVRSNLLLPNNKTVYYSHSHFSPLNKEDKPLSKVISPVDNTGYRFRAGTELHVFDNELDCRTSWNSQILRHIGNIEGLMVTEAQKWQDEKYTLTKQLEE